jgi:putative ABC transport system permease protein
MNLIESIRIALQGISANRLRSGLTTLGLVIGVGAVILLVAVGNGSSIAVQKQINSLGTNTLIVMPNRGFGFGAGRSVVGTQSKSSTLTMADARALSDKTSAPDIKAVAPSVSSSVTATWNGASYSPGQFLGTVPIYPEIRGYTVATGQFFTQADQDTSNRVAVLGQTVVTSLFGSANPIGQTVQFNGASFQVIGVLTPKGTNGAQDLDDIVMAPLSAVQDTLTGFTGSLANITVEAKSQSASNAASAEITAILNQTHKITTGSPDYRILNQSSLLQTSNASHRSFTVLLGAVAAISLLVGGIGVMNIMLVTVTERTREIGIRKAIGARKVDILAQFLVEAVLLSVLGGLLGVAAGVGGSYFKIVGIKPVVALYSVFLAFGVAVATGLFFGLYPANRAASLRPIEALRYE